MGAWNRAAAEINADPQAFRALLLAKVRVPENVRESFDVPPFPTGEIPSRQQWDDVVEWLTEKKLIAGESPFSQSVTGEFL